MHYSGVLDIFDLLLILRPKSPNYIAYFAETTVRMVDLSLVVGTVTSTDLL